MYSPLPEVGLSGDVEFLSPLDTRTDYPRFVARTVFADGLVVFHSEEGTAYYTGLLSALWGKDLNFNLLLPETSRENLRSGSPQVMPPTVNESIDFLRKDDPNPRTSIFVESLSTWELQALLSEKKDVTLTAAHESIVVEYTLVGEELREKRLSLLDKHVTNLALVSLHKRRSPTTVYDAGAVYREVRSMAAARTLSTEGDFQQVIRRLSVSYYEQEMGQ